MGYTILWSVGLIRIHYVTLRLMKITPMNIPSLSLGVKIRVKSQIPLEEIQKMRLHSISTSLERPVMACAFHGRGIDSLHLKFPRLRRRERCQ